MRNPETIESLRLRERIPDFQSKINSLGFQKPQNKEFRETSASEVQKFLEDKIKQQNQEYRQKAEHDRRKSGGYSPAFAKPSDLTGYISRDTSTQINNLLEQAIHNQEKGSFKNRNTSGFRIATSAPEKTFSKLRRALSLTSMSSGGDNQHQKTSSLQKSQSLSSQEQGKIDQKINYKKPIHQKNGESLKTRSPIVKNKPKTFVKRISDVWSRITFKKTKQQNIGSSREGAKPKKVDPKPSRDTSSLSRNSSFASSRSGSISPQSSINHSQSFSGRSPSQSIANRNQSISRSNSTRSSQGSFSYQNSLGSGSSRGSGGSHASRVSQSRSGGANRNDTGR